MTPVIIPLRIFALGLLLLAPSAFAETTPAATPSSTAPSPSDPYASKPSVPATPPAPAAEKTPPTEPAVKATTGEEPKRPPRTEGASAPAESVPTEGSPAPAAPAQTKPSGATPASEKPQGLETPSPESAITESATTQQFIAPPSSDAAETTPPLDRRISLDLRTINVLDILKFLALKANLNLIAGKDIVGDVSLLLNDVSIRDAIDIVLSVNRLAYTIQGNIMRVMTEEEYKGIYGKEFFDKRETKIIRLKYASPKNVGAMLENVKSSVGRIVYDDSTGTVVMTDTSEKMAAMEEIIRHEELPTIVRLPPTTTEIFDMQYAQAAKVSEKLTPTLTKDVGKIYVDDRANRLIVSDLPYKIGEMRELVKAFDTKTREVFIEAKIVQIVLSNKFQAGIDWASVSSGHFQVSSPLTLNAFGQMTVGTIAPKTTTKADGTSSTSFSGSGIIMKFLETFGKTDILSSPQIAVVDGEEAKIMVGSKEAYTTSSVTQSQATTTTAQQVTFVDVGVTLRVTPVINSDGFITMKIKPEVSSVTRFLRTAQGDQIPIVESTNAETRVMVKDGATVLIGGLMGNRRVKARSGLPFLSRIPLVGLAFRSTEDQAINSELSVLLTPHIMSGDETFPGTRPPPVAQVTLPVEGERRDETGARLVETTDPAEIPAEGKKTQRKRTNRLPHRP